MKLTGKYTIKKGNQTVVQKNSLTIYGALQIARLLKRDVIFPKVNSSAFGTIKSYGGQYKKISIIDGSAVSIDKDENSQFNNYKLPTVSSTNGKQYAIDDNYSTYAKFNFNEANNTHYFDLNLKQAVNLGKIGLMAKVQTENYDSNPISYDESSSSLFSQINDWTIYLRPQGVNVSFNYDTGYKDIENSTNETIAMTGDYIRVYNHNYMTHNNKPYFIMNRLVKIDDSTLERRFYCLCCVLLDTNTWAIKDITVRMNQIIENNNSSISEYCLNEKDLNEATNKFTFKDVQNIYNQYNNPITDYKTAAGAQINGVNIMLNSKKINKWMKPAYRLHNYLTKFDESVDTNGFSVLNVEDESRFMQLISDHNQKIKNNKGNTLTENKSISYSTGNSNFNAMLAYSSYSFESYAGVTSLYNFDNVKNNQEAENSFDDDFNNVEYCHQQLVGFIPYVDGIRFVKKNHESSYNNKASVLFYGIDLFVKTITPYNPIKIALTETLNVFNKQNSWFVDSVESIGNNKVVFTKQLDAQQGNTYGDGFIQIGLFGNFDGHLNGSLPANIEIKDTNCFSKAKFAIPWTKSEQESVIITYELTIGE